MPSIELPRGGLRQQQQPKVKFKSNPHSTIPLKSALSKRHQSTIPKTLHSTNSHSTTPKIITKSTTPKPPTTSIYPSEQTLAKLRRAYIGIELPGDYGGYTSDDDSVIEVEDEVEQPIIKNIPSKSKPQISTKNHNLIQSRMQQVQVDTADLKQQIQKLNIKEPEPQIIVNEFQPKQTSRSTPGDPNFSGVSSASKESASCKCDKVTSKPDTQLNTSSSSNSTTPAKPASSGIPSDQQETMLAYIKNQDQQLKLISSQIDELLRIHQNSGSSSSSSNSSFNSKQRTKPKIIDTPPNDRKRSIQTMTSFSSGHDVTDYKKLPGKENPSSRREVPEKRGTTITGEKGQSSRTISKDEPKVITIPSAQSDYLGML